LKSNIQNVTESSLFKEKYDYNLEKTKSGCPVVIDSWPVSLFIQVFDSKKYRKDALVGYFEVL